LQAMFAAIPCVTTDAGAIPEIARDGDTARIVPRENPRALAAAIDAVLDDREASLAMAHRAREYVVPRFGLDVMLDRMERAFRTALADAGRR
jgi:glycosyltransferase involved in cell wall biosynthesis